MTPKSIIIVVLLALVAIILFFNKEESTFWLFGEIKTSKLIILGVFYLLGIISGGILFRRRKKHPKEYGLTNNPNTLETDSLSTQESLYATSRLSDEDRDFIRKD